MRDRSTPYAILDFVNNAAAAAALNRLHNQPIPGTDRVFKLAWYGGSAAGAEYALFVGDLSAEVNDYQLLVCTPIRVGVEQKLI